MRAILFFPLAVLGGCVSLLPEPPPPPRTYVLEAQSVEALQAAPIDAVISIAEPAGERTLLGADLIWRTGDTIAYVDQSAWSNRAADSLQQMLVETMTRQGRFRAAVRAGDAQSDYALRWEILDFEVREETMTARFVADVRVMERGRQIIASRIITAEAPLSDRSSSIAANALARAAREGSARIGVFASDAVAQAQASATTSD